MLSDEKIKKLAELQLQLAVIEGESWAIKHVLGGIKINLTNTDKFEVVITDD